MEEVAPGAWVFSYGARPSFVCVVRSCYGTDDEVIGARGFRALRGRGLSLHVTRLHDRFPERKARKRKWFPTDKAARKVMEPELSAILATFIPPPEPAPAAAPGS